MNTKNILAAAAIFAASATAFAQQTEFVAPDAGFTSTRTRAEVIAEMNQAYQDGTLATQQFDGQPTAVASNGSSRSREEVRAEARQASQDKSNVGLYFGA